jgi:hypothetical protein
MPYDRSYVLNELPVVVFYAAVPFPYSSPGHLRRGPDLPLNRVIMTEMSDSAPWFHCFGTRILDSIRAKY